MGSQAGRGWKVFGIIVIILAVAVVAVLVGRGCERRKNEREDRTTTVTTRAVTDDASPGSSGSEAPPASEVPAEPAAPAAPAIEEPAQEPPQAEAITLVNTYQEAEPCSMGQQKVTTYYEYSDGTSASAIRFEPC